MSNDNNDVKKNISNIFVEDVKNFLSLDDNITELKNKLKKLTSEKNIFEEKILHYLENIDETVIDINNGKLKKTTVKQKGGIKKNYIVDILNETFDDKIKVELLTNKIMEAIPSKEKTSLKRTKK